MFGPAAPRAASLARLVLTDFRNYPYLALAAGPEPVVLTGPNGAGKTNILEAVSLFAPGRGLRRAPLVECARAGGAGGFAVAAEVRGLAGPVRLGTGLADPSDRPGPRQCRIDGAAVRGPGAFADHLRLAWITPAMDRLFSGPAGDRRRFLDRLVGAMEGGHASRIAAYERAMAERNRLLAGGSALGAWLDGLEAEMARHGIAIAAARLAAIDRLAQAIDEGRDAGAFPPARLDLVGTLESALDATSATDAEDAFRDALAAGRGPDRNAGRALSGPHRSDLAAVHGLTGERAERCSTGEQKALVVAIVLAEARIVAQTFTGGAPVLLLDEITAHLDAGRRHGLYDAVAAIGAQAWITGTDRALFDPLGGRARFFRVAAGEVAPE